MAKGPVQKLAPVSQSLGTAVSSKTPAEGLENKLEATLQSILRSFLDLVICDGGSVYVVKRLDRKASMTQVENLRPLKLSFAAMLTDSLQIAEVPESIRTREFLIDESTLVGRTALERRAFKTDGSNVVALSLQPKGVAYRVRNILSAPLVTPRGDLVGVVQLLNKLSAPGGGPAEFSDADQRLLEVIASQAALAIENSQLLEEQEALIEGFVSACVTAVESRDSATSGHSKRVADFTVAFAEAVNRTDQGCFSKTHFTDRQIREIRFAAMLHDLGKVSVSETVLNKSKKLFPWQLEMIRTRLKLMRANLLLHEKITGQSVQPQLERLEFAWAKIHEANEPTVLPSEVSSVIEELTQFEVFTDEGERVQAVTEPECHVLCVKQGSLSAEERHQIERHVSYTYEILKQVPWSRGLENVPEIAYRHHEKLDGTGYPLKANESQISIQTRMLTISDIFDALTADDRPYKKALPLERALSILESDVKHGKLDADLFRIFVDARIGELFLPEEKKIIVPSLSIRKKVA